MSDRIDTKKERLCSYLLPDPGGEAMRRLLDEYVRLQAENERLRSCVSVATAMEQIDMLMAENERLRADRAEMAEFINDGIEDIETALEEFRECRCQYGDYGMLEIKCERCYYADRLYRANAIISSKERAALASKEQES